MALTDNPFIGFPLDEIQSLRTAAAQAILDVLKTGKSNAFPGWSITRADLSELRAMLSELRIAEEATAGTGGGGRQIAYATINTAQQFSGSAP
jgi:hypothetical protein